MIYGSHNALSGYKPLQWYKSVLNFTSKCQSKTIKEQLRVGSRYFDVRLRKHKNEYYGAHGIMLYKITFEQFLIELRDGIKEYDITDTIYFRIAREDTFGKCTEDMYKFREDILALYDKYRGDLPHVKLICIASKSDWNGAVFYNYVQGWGNSWFYNCNKDLMEKSLEIGLAPNCKAPTIGEMYISRGYKWLFGLPIPKKAAKKLRYIVEKRNYNGISVIDFV